MSFSLSRQELQQWRLTNQLGRSPLPADALVAFLGAVQAQENASALLAIRARVPSVTEADLQALLEQQRSVVRTWAIRGTLHLVARDDLHWLLALVAPRLLKNSRRRYRQLGLDEQTLARATELIEQALVQNGALTRAELAVHLEANAISAEGQRMPHLLRRAALLGQLCLGPDRGGEETYVLLDAGVDRPANPGKGWEVLAGRYLAAYGPASVEDFARWAGALKGEARAAFTAQKLLEIESAGNALWLPAPQAERIQNEAKQQLPGARLLPAYDPFLLGYHSRDWLVAPAFAREIHPGGGFLRPTLIVDGEAAGTWKHRQVQDHLLVTVTPFRPLDDRQQSLLQDEVATLGHFYGAQARLVLAPA